MSLEITLYTKRATKNNLIKLLKDNDFNKAQHFIDELNNEDTLHYFWYSFNDYESFAGVEATIFKASDENKERYKCSDWILHTRSKAFGSRIDKQKQNEIIREARRHFGGSFINDWYGTNTYTVLDDYPDQTPAERGLVILYENIQNKLNSLKNCLEEYENPISTNLKSMTDNTFAEIIRMQDPSLVLYNSLLPFCISLLEYFFGETFLILIKYDIRAKKVIASENIKIPLQEVLLIQKGEASIEDFITKSFNFQNLDQINKAYLKFLGIDILNILSKKKKIGNRFIRLNKKVEEIIQRRHQMIHQFTFDFTFQKEDILECLNIVEAVTKHVIQTLEM
jgi:hypothetical protein